LYELEGYKTRLIEAHEGGRNVVYNCEKEGAGAKILRIAFISDRSREDILAEVEYIRYLFEHGGSVADVISSRKGNLVEEITHNNHTFFVCLFEKAKGKLLVENSYRYREGVPITEYYYNCGKVLGKLHQLSKEYTPVHHRYSFFDKYNAKYIDELIPGSLSLLKEKLLELLKTLEGLDRNYESFGMIHFDYCDGNYTIDFNTGQITVFDFDNSCFGWYMYDLANLWTHGVGWIQFEQDAGKRKKFMEDYFETVIAGYRSETSIEKSMLDKLPLFIKVTLMEGIVDAFEVMRNNGEKPECEEELSYLIKCLEDDIPYEGFFHEIYSCEEPFEYEKRSI
jgi:Ser/Thr protein kinase RdoA (MazF antagonist)